MKNKISLYLSFFITIIVIGLFLSGCTKDLTKKLTCELDKKIPYPYQEQKRGLNGLNENVCNCEVGNKGVWVAYKTCPGQETEINKYVTVITHISCQRLKEIDKRNWLMSGIINVGFNYFIPYPDVKNLIEKYNGEIIINNCRWVYGEELDNVSQPMVMVKVNEEMEYEFIKNITQEIGVKYATQNIVFRGF